MRGRGVVFTFSNESYTFEIAGDSHLEQMASSYTSCDLRCV